MQVSVESSVQTTSNSSCSFFFSASLCQSCLIILSMVDCELSLLILLLLLLSMSTWEAPFYPLSKATARALVTYMASSYNYILHLHRTQIVGSYECLSAHTLYIYCLSEELEGMCTWWTKEYNGRQSLLALRHIRCVLSRSNITPWCYDGWELFD